MALLDSPESLPVTDDELELSSGELLEMDEADWMLSDLN
jgi:hypothetical protein